MANLFETQKAKGDKGEKMVLEAMEARGHKVEDLTSNKEYFAKDIDYIIAGKYCEVKTDYVIARTNNLFLENLIEYKNEKPSKKGYFKVTEAEYLFYLDIKNKVLYIYKMEDLRTYIKEHPLTQQRCVNDGYKVVTGYCLNKDLVCHQTIQI